MIHDHPSGDHQGLASAILEPFPCLLCRGPAAYRGVWVPSRPLPGVPPGTAVLYGICCRCARKPRRVIRRVEERILGDLAALARTN
jgi:hypothetical protein